MHVYSTSAVEKREERKDVIMPDIIELEGKKICIHAKCKKDGIVDLSDEANGPRIIVRVKIEMYPDEIEKTLTLGCKGASSMSFPEELKDLVRKDRGLILVCSIPSAAAIDPKATVSVPNQLSIDTVIIENWQLSVDSSEK